VFFRGGRGRLRRAPIDENDRQGVDQGTSHPLLLASAMLLAKEKPTRERAPVAPRAQVVRFAIAPSGRAISQQRSMRRHAHCGYVERCCVAHEPMARDRATRDGKRLCSETEWTFACEGEEAWPHPYGYTRSPEICDIDRPWRGFDQRAFWDRSSRAAMLELDRLWQGEASGSRPACRSPFGIYDMTGNVDEWTQSVSTQGHCSILKGGYWGQVRSRCRPSTRVHDEDFAFYQQGFRCCADLPMK